MSLLDDLKTSVALEGLTAALKEGDSMASELYLSRLLDCLGYVPPVRKAEHLPVPDGYGWLLECEGRYGLGENQLYNIRSVIDGNMVKLSSCFEWSKEKHGHEYWFERNVGRAPLSDTDKQFLRYLLREYREAKSDD